MSLLHRYKTPLTPLGLKTSGTQASSAAFKYLSQVSPLLHDGCCFDFLDENGTCNQCKSGCYMHVYENGSSSCIRCNNETQPDVNSTYCSDVHSTDYDLESKSGTGVPTLDRIGGPGVAASLLLGTLFISLFLILSVASFFYFKRSKKLPDVFYRRNKASILQPSETAAMIYTHTSSVRKPRYTRRERSSAMNSAVPITSTESRVSNV
ncbi:uncharacterized protein C1orf159 homolog isoform X2 [Protopterus annectens]|uniref:uncharacterized protein C1orf159 homolog isoform X2 n=1 Tax=Protopterus annectens TaxID=7888 RepID=UPI001CFAFC7E|nr:uncharacterized protein C1orf159 homolog isoform X2 [Protopterus annectens]